MVYNNLTGRAQAGGLVPPEHANEIIKSGTQLSTALSTFRRMPISTNEKTIPVMSGLPSAYWITPTATDPQNPVDTTQAQWENVTMYVEDLGVVAPMPARVVDDVKAGNINLTEEMIPYLSEAASVLIDKAVFFGVNKPSSWPAAIVSAAAAVNRTADSYAANDNNTVTRGTSTVKQGGLAGDINLLNRILRAQGYRPNAYFARPTFEFDLDNARDDNGQKLLDVNKNTFGGRPILYGGDGVWPAESAGNASLISMDTSKFLIGLRKDMEFTIHTEGVITDNAGKVILNLMQQNAIAVRLIMRIGYAVANPVNIAEPTKANRYPAGVLIEPTPPVGP